MVGSHWPICIGEIEPEAGGGGANKSTSETHAIERPVHLLVKGVLCGIADYLITSIFSLCC